MFCHPKKERGKKNARPSFTAGFTLVEMLTTIVIFTVIMGGAALLFKTIFNTSTQQTLAVNTTDQARKAAFDFTNEMRNGTTGSDGAYPLNQAGDSQIVFYSSYGVTGTTVNRIRYFVNSATSTLYRGVITPTGNPPTYNLASEIVKPIQKGLANKNTPVFYYFNDSYAGTSSPLVQPVNINQVKFVKINLILLKQDVKNATTTFTVSSGTTVRNLKTNLGN